MQFYCVIGNLSKGKLRITRNNKEVLRIESVEGDGKSLSEEVTQAIKNNEAIAATYTSVKEEKMEGAWIIEDVYLINKSEGAVVSNQWKHNTAMAAEALTIFDLVATVVRNLGATKKGKLKVCTDCKVICDVLMLDRIKSSQFALDGGGIISKIV